jgi:release factor glutamine methyltransferase
MTVKEALRQATDLLASHDIEDARLESEILLRQVLQLSRVELYQELDHRLDSKQAKDFQQLVKRRLSGEPTAYITGHREFYGLDFQVNRDVLIPRPETELLVERARALAQDRPLAIIADIGTGCGAIAVSLAINLPQSRIYATDISAAALKVARAHCQRYGVSDRVTLFAGDLLAPLPEPVNLIVANLPYVSEAEVSQTKTSRFEPKTALNGGQDGLDKIRQLCYGLRTKLRAGGSLLLEIGEGQGRPLTAFLRELFPPAEIEITPDLSGIDRVLRVTLTDEETSP